MTLEDILDTILSVVAFVGPFILLFFIVEAL